MMAGPKVYRSIAGVANELSKRGIGKGRTNAQEHYQFRSIDDVYNRLSPVLAKHKLCILPQVLEHNAVERHGSEGALLLSVTLKVAYHIISAEDGSSHVIEVFGEALDEGDKATSKAMSAAYKYALLQAFCIPVVGQEDPDGRTHTLRRVEGVAEPVQGWEQWSRDISSVVDGCASGEAVDRVQDTYRPVLRAVAKARPEIYCAIGEVIARKRRELTATRKDASSPSVAARCEEGVTQELSVGNLNGSARPKEALGLSPVNPAGLSTAARKGNGADYRTQGAQGGGHA
jgi:hypothetical protein